MLKRLYQFGFIGYGLLFLLAIMFYKERAIFTDIAFHLFSIIRDRGFAIQNFRFGAIITQIFPWTARKLCLPLNTIAFLYTLGFVICYFTAYVLCGSILKQYNFALIILLFNILFVTDTFYWIQSELPQGAVIMILMLGYMAYLTKKKLDIGLSVSPINYSILFFACFTIGFCHPLLMFPFFFITLFFLISKQVFIEKQLIYAVALFYCLVILIKRIAFKTPYDIAAMDNSKHALDNYKQFFQIYATKSFLKNCIKQYYWIPILFLVIITYYIKNRKWFKFLFFLGAVLGYWALINLSYPGKEVQSYYIENLYLPIGIILSVPLVFDILQQINVKHEKMLVGIFLLVITTGGWRIFNNHHKFTERLQWERNFLAANRNEKLIVEEKRMPMDTLMVSWGTSYEFWLLSTIENQASASIIIADNPDQFKYAEENKRAFLSMWGFDDYNNYPKQYFIFKDTIHHYQILK